MTITELEQLEERVTALEDVVFEIIRYISRDSGMDNRRGKGHDWLREKLKEGREVRGN